ncbi:hypothetical protein SPSIL_055960 [Sporomusa silvacetica DSM 10669]|uniref:Uncharacterized protein n=1 Tax=Sporomusa silvacetica DSM 10669 TaxID=1123289 RepID=A0ABZ3IVA8_9FIRM|nr:hypothetical protein SPSIL_57390 [Sporomusa silvacetica DSM 10669]
MAKKQEQCKSGCKEEKNVEFGKEICPSAKEVKKEEKCRR